MLLGFGDTVTEGRREREAC